MALLAAQGVAAESEGGPLVHGFCAEALVEPDRGFVPVEHLPFEAGVTALDADRRKGREQLAAVAAAAVLLTHVEIFEVDAVDPLPGREGEEPDRHAGQ